MMTLRLAGEGRFFSRSGFYDMSEEEKPPADEIPAILISYAYREDFDRYRKKIVRRSWALDSGAFSAYNSGKKVVLEDYIEYCLRNMESDHSLVEVFGLDVIEDPKQGQRNVDKMWEAGIPAIPTYHLGEPEKILLRLARDYPKIALGGMSSLRGKMKREWPIAIFKKIWPCKVHGFATTGRNDILRVPWHSVDSTTWFTGPQSFGMWRAYGGRMCVRGGIKKKSYAPEVKTYLHLEKMCNLRWRKLYRELADKERQDEGVSWPRSK